MFGLVKSRAISRGTRLSNLFVFKECYLAAKSRQCVISLLPSFRTVWKYCSSHEITNKKSRISTKYSYLGVSGKKVATVVSGLQNGEKPFMP